MVRSCSLGSPVRWACATCALLRSTSIVALLQYQSLFNSANVRRGLGVSSMGGGWELLRCSLLCRALSLPSAGASMGIRLFRCASGMDASPHLGRGDTPRVLLTDTALSPKGPRVKSSFNSNNAVFVLYPVRWSCW